MSEDDKPDRLGAHAQGPGEIELVTITRWLLHAFAVLIGIKVGTGCLTENKPFRCRSSFRAPVKRRMEGARMRRRRRLWGRSCSGSISSSG